MTVIIIVIIIIIIIIDVITRPIIILIIILLSRGVNKRFAFTFCESNSTQLRIKFVNDSQKIL